jgi:hypothetical protein
VLGRTRVAAWVVLGLFAATLGACSGTSLEGFAFGKPPPPPPAPNPNIYPTHYREQVAAFMRHYLSNPRKVKDAYISEPAMKPIGGTPHYVSCVRYNPQDLANQYEGQKIRQATFLSGEIIQFMEPEGDNCNGAVYQRFPAVESMVP